MLKYNPFKPGSIVHPGMFSGRLEEIKTLENALFQTKNGNPSHFLIHGERGIGKSSLLMLISYYAAGELTTLQDQNFNFLVLNIELDPNDDYSNLVYKIARELKRVLSKNEVVRKRLSDIWSFVTSWEVLGVKYNRKNDANDNIIEDLSERFIAVCDRLSTTIDGIYIFIDEADKPPSSTNLGEFIKIFTERLTKSGCGNVGLGIVGITTVLKKLRKSHESSVRILQPIKLGPLLYEESKEVVKKGLQEANEKNSFETSISEKALARIANLSEGYPHFIQQYAFSSFEHDTDQLIGEIDVVQALIKENGALHQLGIRYFENWYSGEIFSDDYRTVLQTLASNPNRYTTRKELLEKSGLKIHTINNALTALKKKNIIVPKIGKRGEYRLPSRSFASWIYAFKIVKLVTEQNNAADR